MGSPRAACFGPVLRLCLWCGRGPWSAAWARCVSWLGACSGSRGGRRSRVRPLGRLQRASGPFSVGVLGWVFGALSSVVPAPARPRSATRTRCRVQGGGSVGGLVLERGGRRNQGLASLAVLSGDVALMSVPGFYCRGGALLTVMCCPTPQATPRSGP